MMKIDLVAPMVQVNITERQQVIDDTNTFSSLCVFQGSVLGPLLFLNVVFGMSVIVKNL
jgi:hypothetical protein